MIKIQYIGTESIQQRTSIDQRSVLPLHWFAGHVQVKHQAKDQSNITLSSPAG